MNHITADAGTLQTAEVNDLVRLKFDDLQAVLELGQLLAEHLHIDKTLFIRGNIEDLFPCQNILKICIQRGIILQDIGIVLHSGYLILTDTDLIGELLL